MANEYQGWRGAVEPAESAGSGNEYQGWRGAVEPSEPVGGTGVVHSIAGPGGIAGHGGIAGKHGGIAG